MKNVRIWFTKDGAARYISHLDLNRCMSRVVHRAKIPIWYTEGFNPHPYLTFALPLSLGVRGKRESMDLKLLEEMPEQELIERLNACLPTDIRVYAATEPEMKPGRIAFARYDLILKPEGNDGEDILKTVNNVLALPQVLVEKKSKAGLKEVDLKKNLCEYTLEPQKDGVHMNVLLPAGSVNNINPSLIPTAISKYTGIQLTSDITRQELYNEEKKPFR